jgi:hypothetical protein
MSIILFMFEVQKESRTTAGLDGVTTLPNHGGDGAAQHVCRNN